MRIVHGVPTAMAAIVMAAASPGIRASSRDDGAETAQLVITLRGAAGKPRILSTGEVTVLQNKMQAPVVHFQRLTGDQADLQLFVLLDDSARSSSLGIHLPELKAFLESLPATTQVAAGYMRNGSFTLDQPFTADHRKAADSLRLPIAVPGENGSPYFALADLVKHWPSEEPTGRRAVLMLTDGVDRYYDAAIMDDPYVDAAIQEALKKGVLVYSVYIRDAGLYDRRDWITNMAQSRLLQVSRETGGYAYFEDFTDPVSISPFLKDLQERFNHQYRLTIEARGGKGFQPVQLRTELPGLKVDGPKQVYVP